MNDPASPPKNEASHTEVTDVYEKCRVIKVGHLTYGNEIEKTDFGVNKHDVMEVSVYDVNNNLLPQKSGNTVAYIHASNVKNYLYNLTNSLGQKEVAINVEKGEMFLKWPWEKVY